MLLLIILLCGQETSLRSTFHLLLLATASVNAISYVCYSSLAQPQRYPQHTCSGEQQPLHSALTDSLTCVWCTKPQKTNCCWWCSSTRPGHFKHSSNAPPSTALLTRTECVRGLLPLVSAQHSVSRFSHAFIHKFIAVQI